MKTVIQVKQGRQLYRSIRSFGLILLCLMLAGCNLLDPSDERVEPATGELQLSFTTAKLFPARIIEPPIDLTLDRYEIFGSGPNEAAFEESQEPGSGIFKIGLTPGRWTIQVDGKNQAGQRIGAGEVVLDIQPGVVHRQEVIIHPLEGSGQLEIRIAWPDSILADPLVRGSIESSDDQTSSLDFVLAGDLLSAVCVDTLAAGYYKISLQLTDAGVPVWGAVEAARVVAGYPSATSYTLVAEVNRSAFRIVLADGMESPIDITLSGAKKVLAAGETMTVIAEAGEPVEHYEWYLQGERIAGASAAAITLGESLSGGIYRLDVLVTKGAVMSSDGVDFEVIDPGSGSIAIGPLVINEIMIKPDSVADSDGEWMEVANIGTTAVNMKDWIIKDEDSNTHTIRNSLLIPAGGFVVLGANADSALNDQVPVDYEYSGITLANGDDELLLVSPTGELVDAVRWGGAYDFPIESGKSIALINPALDNRRSKNWQAATKKYGRWNKGTPGTEN